MHGHVGNAVVKLNPLLRMAAITGVEIAVKFHIARGDNLDARDSGGATALMLAAARRKKGVIRLLLAAGANPGLLDSKGRGGIVYAERGGCLECITLLREASGVFGRLNGGGISDEASSAPSDLKACPATEALQVTHASEYETVGTVNQDRVTMFDDCPSARQDSKLESASSELDDLFNFETEEAPEEFFARSNSESASGSFVAIIGSEPLVLDDRGMDWELDLSSAQITGDGIGGKTPVTADPGSDNDFLKVRNRGRKSVKRAVLQTGTRLSIDPEICIAWAEETLMKGWCSYDDVDRLVNVSEGNVSFEELRINLQRNLEAAGFAPIDRSDEQDLVQWDTRSDVSSGDLAEAVEALLTRKVLLPGTQKFRMDKSYEQQLVEPIAKAKRELQLGILASDAAVAVILEAFDSIRDGRRSPDSVSLNIITPSRLSHTEMDEIMAAVETLRFWLASGRAMEGKRRREALEALDALDISLVFHKEMVCSLAQQKESIEHSIQLNRLISLYEAATARLIHEHLPFARRFAARNVGKGEDPEDVFQVVFTGLQRSTRRFDLKRGDRFVIYCTFWMQQALMRWRADEGRSIRVPAHRYQNLMMLDRALAKLDVQTDNLVSDNKLAVELGWSTDQVREFRRIPRNAEYFESIEDWDELLPVQEHEDIFSDAETVKIVGDALAELDSREAAVIKMRFGIGLDKEMTLEEIGTYYNLTRERIRQIETKAIQRLSLPARKARLKKLMGII